MTAKIWVVIFVVLLVLYIPWGFGHLIECSAHDSLFSCMFIKTL